METTKTAKKTEQVQHASYHFTGEIARGDETPYFDVDFFCGPTLLARIKSDGNGGCAVFWWKVERGSVERTAAEVFLAVEAKRILDTKDPWFDAPEEAAIAVVPEYYVSK